MGPGAVNIGPSQLGTEVLETVGDASQVEPGYVTLSNGEVTFRISLPLEASGLVPSRVTIIGGNDAGTIFWDQQNVDTRLPDGFRIAVYDAVATDWIDLGDLAARTRFDVPEPTRVLDSAGRILIRISASGVPPEFGQPNVFAGASIAGVISR
jgi:hypothetical protein